ncbi:MAG: hypothetical protein M1839_003519 [Geoglossum umbratile]|nr:MAG: hypothetical protein M1839_003519 [Geoglossum umbratile]
MKERDSKAGKAEPGRENKLGHGITRKGKTTAESSNGLLRRLSGDRTSIRRELATLHRQLATLLRELTVLAPLLRELAALAAALGQTDNMDLQALGRIGRLFCGLHERVAEVERRVNLVAAIVGHITGV